MLTLYDNMDSGNAYKVRLALAHLGVAFERVELDTDNGETRTAEYLGKNPNGKVPALEVGGGEVLCESDAISPTARRSCRTTSSPAPACCSGCSSNSTATSRTSPCPGTC